MAERTYTWFKIYREKMNIKREGKVTLVKKKGIEGEVVMHAGGDAWNTHRTCNNISCMNIMEKQVDISTTQHRYAHDANI